MHVDAATLTHKVNLPPTAANIELCLISRVILVTFSSTRWRMDIGDIFAVSITGVHKPEAHVLRFCSRTLKAAENFSAHIDLAFLFVLTETADEFQLVWISVFLYFAAIQHLIML